VSTRTPAVTLRAFTEAWRQWRQQQGSLRQHHGANTDMPALLLPHVLLTGPSQAISLIAPNNCARYLFAATLAFNRFNIDNVTECGLRKWRCVWAGHCSFAFSVFSLCHMSRHRLLPPDARCRSPWKHRHLGIQCLRSQFLRGAR